MTNSNALSDLVLSVFCKERVKVISWKQTSEKPLVKSGRHTPVFVYILSYLTHTHTHTVMGRTVSPKGICWRDM